MQVVSSAKGLERKFDFRRESQGTAGKTWYIGGPDLTPDGPRAQLNEHLAPGRTIYRPHFHTVTQFQVFTAGTGRLGRHDVEPATVQYTDAFTPYGPLVTDSSSAFFVFRVGVDPPGAQFMPESRGALDARSDQDKARRQLFGVAKLAEDVHGRTDLRPLFPSHDDGLGAWEMVLPPDGSMVGPDPAISAGQYYLVLTGSLVVAGDDIPGWSVLFLTPADPPLVVTAGVHGLRTLVLQFPRTKAA